LSLARRLPATLVRITGVRGAHRLSDGSLLQESPGVAQRRAEEIARLLAGAGLEARTEVDWVDGLDEANGQDDWRSRRVTVVITP
jgi:aspartate oxidase